MTPQIIITLGVILGAVFLFVTEWLRVDLVALLVLGSLALSGLVTPTEALSGLPKKISRGISGTVPWLRTFCSYIVIVLVTVLLHEEDLSPLMRFPGSPTFSSGHVCARFIFWPYNSVD